jgi:type I restriction enzyme S subunit
MYGSIGKAGINTIECASNQAIAHCNPDRARVDARYLFTLVCGVRDDLFTQGKGMAQQNISQTILKHLVVPIPPLAEQKRIVAKVDELMALCDELEEKQQRKATVTTKLRGSAFNALRQAETPDDLADAWERISTNWSNLTNHPDSIPELRQPIFDLATSGCLSSGDVGDGFGADVVTESQMGRKQKLGPNLETPPSRKGLGLPETWIWSDLDSLCVTQTGATPAKEETESSGIPRITYISPAQIDSGIVIETNKVAHTASIKRTAGPGSLLFVGIGGSIGKVGVCVQEVTFNQQIHAASPIIADSRYLWIALSSSAFQLETKRRTSATAIPIINKSKWESIPIPVPPLPEQKRIVAKVDELMAMCDELETHLQHQQHLSSRLAIASTRLAG